MKRQDVENDVLLTMMRFAFIQGMISGMRVLRETLEEKEKTGITLEDVKVCLKKMEENLLECLPESFRYWDDYHEMNLNDLFGRQNCGVQ